MKRKGHYPKKGLKISKLIPLLGILVLFIMVVPGLTAAGNELNGASPGIKAQALNESRQNEKGPYVPGEVLVKFKEGVDRAQADSLATEHNCLVEESIATIRLHRMKIMDQRDVWGVAAEFEAKPNVEYAEPNFIDVPVGVPVYDKMLSGDVPAITPLDPMYGNQWHYPLINMPDAWNVNAGGTASSVIAAVVDTGVRFDHPDLSARLSGNGYDFIDLDNDPTDPGSGSPAYSHGTHVAGTVGAATNNATGVTGMTWRGLILPVRAVGTAFQMAQGFRYAAGLLEFPDPVNPTPVKVLNYSAGGPHSTTKQLAVADCNAAGVIMVCAAGNDYGGAVIYPAAYSTIYDKVIAVAATDYNYGGSPQRAPYSNVGVAINVAAPGGDTTVDSDGDGNPDGVLSTAWNYVTSSPTYEFWQGTSMASPHVTGLVALMLQQGINADSVRSILQSTAVDLGTPGFDNEFGHGLINAKAALDAVPKIAIIATTTTTDSVDQALTELGRIYAKFNTADFNSVDLSPYGTVIVAMDGGLPDSADIQHLANFANDGGNLIMLGGSSLSDFAIAVDTYLLDIDTVTTTWKTVTVSPNLEVTTPMHQLAQGLPAAYDFVNNSASYYMIRSQDSAAEEAAINGDGETALLKKKMGNGTLTWFINSPNHLYWSDNADYTVLKQIIENALGISFASPDGATRGLAWDGNLLWSVDSGDGTSVAGSAYYQINPATGAVVNGFVYTGNSFPLGLTFDGTNIWSSDWASSGTIYKRNPADMSVISSFVSPRAQPADLAWDGTYLWAIIYPSGPIIKIDQATGAEVGSIPVPPGSSQTIGLAYAMGYLYLGADGTDTIYKLDPATGAVMDSWPSPGPYPCGLAFDGAYLWVSDWTTDRIYRMMKLMSGGATTLWDNGPLVNSPGTGAGGADESVLQSTSLGMNTYGFGHQKSEGYRIADDFTVSGSGWQIDEIMFFAYQTNSTTTSTLTEVNYNIWDGSPDNPASSIIFSDTVALTAGVNTAWSNIYRVMETTSGDTTRPIMENTVSPGIFLPPGTYWLDWQTDGSLASGPWAPPITISGQTTTGNALQYTTSWAPALDSGTSTQQGFPFIIMGEEGPSFGDELAVDFGGNGLWHYDGTAWNQLSSQNPDGMEEWSGGLAGDFSTSGLWNYDGTDWAQLSAWNPAAMEAWADGLAVDFNASGLWTYDGSWSLLTTNNAEDLQAWSGGLAVDFGDFGLWNYNGALWSLLTTSNAEDLQAWSGGLAVDFGDFGLWNYNGAWSLLTTNNPTLLQSWANGLAANFGSGLWSYDSALWSLLTTTYAYGMTDWANGLAVDFNAFGLWNHNGASWSLLTTTNPEDMEGWANSLAGDFGGNGLWNYDGSSWSLLTNWNGEVIVSVTFGAPPTTTTTTTTTSTTTTSSTTTSLPTATTDTSTTFTSTTFTIPTTTTTTTTSTVISTTSAPTTSSTAVTTTPTTLPTTMPTLPPWP